MKTLLENILPAQALGIEIADWSNGRVELTAPLGPNLNDKGTAFAGSIDALLDLAGWSAITLALRDAGLEADVMIVKSETEYTAAVRAGMAATVVLPENERARMLRELHETGRSRLVLHCRLSSGNQACASMSAHYAIIAGESR